VQVRQDVDILSVPPRSGTLTSCSMYLKEHFVVLNRGEGNFGLHCGAILLDPIKTFGTNVMLEIYNSGDQPVVNPMVSVEVFRAPTFADPEVKRWNGSAAASSPSPATSTAAWTEARRATAPANRARRPASPSRARMR